MRRRFLKKFFLFIPIGIFLSGELGFSQEEKPEKLEDYSKYGYTLKYKNKNVYTTEPGEKKSPYHQGGPELPPALEERSKSSQWSKPERLQNVKPEELYMPPEEVLGGNLYLPSPKEEIEKTASPTKEEELIPEGFIEKVKVAIEEVTGKEVEIKLTREETNLVQPVTPPEEEEEKEPEEKPTEKLFKEIWEIIVTEGRVSLKPLGNVPQEDLDKIARYLVELLGRGGEIVKIGAEGIEIKVK